MKSITMASAMAAATLGSIGLGGNYLSGKDRYRQYIHQLKVVKAKKKKKKQQKASKRRNKG